EHPGERPLGPATRGDPGHRRAAALRPGGLARRRPAAHPAPLGARVNPGATMTREPTVAVVVPTYRRPAALRRCLDAVRAGSRLPDQVWICDQSPDDATRAVAESSPGIRY